VIAAIGFFDNCLALWAILPTVLLSHIVHTFVSDIFASLAWMMCVPTILFNTTSQRVALITLTDAVGILPRDPFAVGII
jgi:hypothetical protein